jgi:hypothetical protein
VRSRKCVLATSRLFSPHERPVNWTIQLRGLLLLDEEQSSERDHERESKEDREEQDHSGFSIEEERNRACEASKPRSAEPVENLKSVAATTTSAVCAVYTVVTVTEDVTEREISVQIIGRIRITLLGHYIYLLRSIKDLEDLWKEPTR